MAVGYCNIQHYFAEKEKSVPIQCTNGTQFRLAAYLIATTMAGLEQR